MVERTLGFAGLGRMGGPMAGRLIAAGYDLIGYDPAGARERLPETARVANSIAELAASADVMLLSVPDGHVSIEICREIAATPSRRAGVVVDLSTIGIVAAREAAGVLSQAGVSLVDAPVSGGIAGAKGGTLAMMVGTSAETYADVEPILSVLASKRFRVGDDPGHGQTMKLLNNFVSGMTLAATSEATVFGAHMGLDMETMVTVLNSATGRSAVSEDKFPRSIVPRTYDFGFAGALMTKDVTLYHENAVAADVPHDLADAAAAIWQRFNAACPDADFTYIHKYLEDQNQD
jgi:3-hydroxyisobutyrate dehydrogenase